MAEEKKKVNRKKPRLTDQDRKKIYNEERLKQKQKFTDEIRERLVIVCGSLLFPLFILFSGLIVGVGVPLYLVAYAPDAMREAFVNNPLGISGDLVFVGIGSFTFWVMFGLTGFYCFVKAEEILKKKPELRKKMKIWNWRKM